MTSPRPITRVTRIYAPRLTLNNRPHFVSLRGLFDQVPERLWRFASWADTLVHVAEVLKGDLVSRDDYDGSMDVRMLPSDPRAGAYTR